MTFATFINQESQALLLVIPKVMNVGSVQIRVTCELDCFTGS